MAEMLPHLFDIARCSLSYSCSFLTTHIASKETKQKKRQISGFKKCLFFLLYTLTILGCSLHKSNMECSIFGGGGGIKSLLCGFHQMIDTSWCSSQSQPWAAAMKAAHCAALLHSLSDLMVNPTLQRTRKESKEESLGSCSTHAAGCSS